MTAIGREYAATIKKRGKRMKTGNRKTISCFEGLRGAAALLVVLLHMRLKWPFLGFTYNGYLAVDLFFVLSGYVICRSYSGQLMGPAQFWVFVIRRFGRLWPVHVATTVLFLIIGNALLMSWPPVIPSPTEALALASMTQGLNLFDHYVGTGVSWSASDEFYAYLIFAALCLFFRRRARLLAFLVLALAGYAMAIWCAAGTQFDCLRRGECLNMTYSYGWTRCLAGFFIGVLIFELNEHRLLRIVSGKRSAQVLAFLAVALLLWLSSVKPAVAFAAPLVFGALIASLQSDGGPVARLFQCRPALYLGKISYSLYLGHGVIAPLFVVLYDRTANLTAQAALCAVFLFQSIALAHLLYRFVETPLRDRFYSWSNTAFRSLSVNATDRVHS
ncbi:Peptidoglycan/LPS O-acetylase OafA/YrhL, contains acyltransferase and SGNH-hydrolase domains [Paraburkholderia hospita]|jgi:peptidoglycan/LPS O-acetylase OafA/YrhL|nr:acyltransferase [Paraburkholderia hospita]SEI16517.1 Peptidoglycan/LPS O-acetylase OafA/YrhL, contains acyltransferase and SGNH-hydrolase domains [Paraburkholderia hospita]